MSIHNLVNAAAGAWDRARAPPYARRRRAASIQQTCAKARCTARGLPTKRPNALAAPRAHVPFPCTYALGRTAQSGTPSLDDSSTALVVILTPKVSTTICTGICIWDPRASRTTFSLSPRAPDVHAPRRPSVNTAPASTHGTRQVTTQHLYVLEPSSHAHACSTTPYCVRAPDDAVPAPRARTPSTTALLAARSPTPHRAIAPDPAPVP
ncbi:hypothetical protein B0H12DRAFT_1229237 [Mycena haematopus]|nr:hypothetical protein B0H12DRAFT_1238027 [Mycena haematopus]KAJ7270764.1 hypothetical protein B0H12DRAFT_1229237 [Mycena haematopus]